jgi:hypothetical protein
MPAHPWPLLRRMQSSGKHPMTEPADLDWARLLWIGQRTGTPIYRTIPKDFRGASRRLRISTPTPRKRSPDEPVRSDPTHFGSPRR